MNPFEAIMLVCFGLAWPFDILKTLRTKDVEGKSPIFMIVVAMGYTSGILHKYFSTLDWVTYLYVFNLILVLFDVFLYFYYIKKVQCVSGRNV